MFGDKDAKNCREVRAEIIKVCNKAKDDRVEAAVVAFAMAQVMRALLSKYSGATRQVLLEDTIIPFLQNAQATDEDNRIVRLM
jgi:hypothetical protein